MRLTKPIVCKLKQIIFWFCTHTGSVSTWRLLSSLKLFTESGKYQGKSNIRKFDYYCMRWLHWFLCQYTAIAVLWTHASACVCRSCGFMLLHTQLANCIEMSDYLKWQIKGFLILYNWRFKGVPQFLKNTALELDVNFSYHGRGHHTADVLYFTQFRLSVHEYVFKEEW